MKNPDQTIEKFKLFTKRIDSEYYRINFLLTGGYLMFIKDLMEISEQLSKSCKRILEKHGDYIS